MPKDLSGQLALLMETSRPVSDYANDTVAANGHHCNLPVFVGFPVSLDPRTGERASTHLIVQCTDCSALWGVQKRRHAYNNGPDLIWVEKRPWTRHGRSLLRVRAVGFSATAAYRRPDPTTIDWSKRGPRKPDGMRWHQVEFPEMLGEGAEQCVSRTRLGHGKVGQPMVWTTYQCLLKTHHVGMHESFDTENGVVGWSYGFNLEAV